MGTAKSDKATRSLAELDRMVARYGEKKLALAAAQEARRQAIATVTAREAVKVNRAAGQLSSLEKAIKAKAEEDRDLLTNGGKTKLIKLPSGGKLRWYMKSKIDLTRPLSSVIASLKKAGLSRFVRVKTIESVDKLAMVRDAGSLRGIGGVNVISAEAFGITPHGD